LRAQSARLGGVDEARIGIFVFAHWPVFIVRCVTVY
jgi:hypothetical protein